MYEIYSQRTGRVVRRCNNREQADKLVVIYDETYEWINNDRFESRLADENKIKSGKQRQKTYRMVKEYRRSTNSLRLV